MPVSCHDRSLHKFYPFSLREKVGMRGSTGHYTNRSSMRPPLAAVYFLSVALAKEIL